MNTKTILCLLAAACLTACSSDDDEQITPTERPLTVVVGENPMPEEDAEGRNAPATRGTQFTTESLTSFSMNYGENKYTISKSKDGWITNPNYWPIDVANDTPITFYAYNGGTYNDNSGNPYLSYTMADNVSDTKDLLVAKSAEVTYNGTTGIVPLTFDHACVALDFKVKITNTLASELNKDAPQNAVVKINSIVLQGIQNSGYYNYTNKNWTDVSGSANYTLTNSDINVTTTPQNLSDNTNGTLFIIPQTVTNNTKLVITFSDDKTSTIALLNNVIWTSPRHNTVTIKIGTNLYKNKTQTQ